MSTTSVTLPDPRLDGRALAVALGVVRASVPPPVVPSPRRTIVAGRSPLEASGWADAETA